MEPVAVICPFCESVTPTEVKPKLDCFFKVFMILMSIMCFCIICCWWKDKSIFFHEHYCANCKEYLGTTFPKEKKFVNTDKEVDIEYFPDLEENISRITKQRENRKLKVVVKEGRNCKIEDASKIVMQNILKE